MTYDLTHFKQVQLLGYPRALAEIRSGKKTSHWMWYIFPQLKGLGRSSLSAYYGIRDLGEARAYLADPVLGPRLAEICRALLVLDTDDAAAVMGRPDDRKLRSSMTLFNAAADTPGVFQAVLDKYYQGRRDRRTLRMLGLE